MITTRFAPSPTGALHIGGARTALFNYLWARRCGGKFLIRFEDTDKIRSEVRYEKTIMDDLEWLGLGPDGGVTRQSSRCDRHSEVLNMLSQNGSVYPCFCADSDSDEPRRRHKCGNIPASEREARLASGEAHCWRFRIPDGEKYEYRDRLRGVISVPMDSIGDFVVSRSDGSVTYLMAVVADDHDSRVTHVIRGEEHLSNVPKQELIYKALGWEVPEWVHIPMILDENRHKLSKRSGAISIGQYRELGWAHGAVTSYLATLSWSLAPADRILTPDELAEIFDLDSVALVSPVHDEARMRHFGRVYMAGLSHEELLEECRDFFGARQDPELPDSEKISLIRELAAVCFTVRELGKQIETELAYRDCPATEKIPEWFGGFLEFLNSVPDADWRSEKLKSSMKIFQGERGLKGKDFFHPVRILLTGMPQGAPIGIILSCIGKNEALRRLGNRRL